jgi:tetratricopeptide (TPR) repeat protein
MRQQSSGTSGTSLPLDFELARIRELSKARRHGEALCAAEALAFTAPGNSDALYLIAANQRCLHRVRDALRTLERLEQLEFRFGRLYQERGHCYVALRDAAHAIDAFREAVRLNPALVTSWSMLEGLYRLIGDARNAETARAQIAIIRQLPSEVVQAGSLFSDGELTAAENVLRAYLAIGGRHVEASRLLARVAHQRDELDEAQLLLEDVLRLAPDYRAARLDYLRVLIDRHEHLRAREETGRLLEHDPECKEYLTLYAAACAGLGDQETAIGLYRRVLTDTSESPDLHVLIGHSLQAVGRPTEAIESYKAAAAARPSFGDAYWSLANLKVYRFSADEISCMRAAEADPAVHPVDRYHLCFALGKALEDRGEYEESWRCYERGNALKRAEGYYCPEVAEINARKQIEVCTPEFFATRNGVGEPDPAPIFIVGLPRSGSTLIDQILASHSMVEGTRELPYIHRTALELQRRQSDDGNDAGYPARLRDLAPSDFHRLGERYITDTRAYRNGKPFFVDKMPNNFVHIGLIHLMLPNAKIIDARRDPLGCCFSNLKQLFARGQGFAYSTEDVARYYRSYLELMRHWDGVLPGRVLRVCYEEVIDDVQRNVRRILEFCGLDLEPACLEFHKTERSVSTASSEQVRQPIFREGLSQWKNYERWLGPLRDNLGDALIRYRD